MALKGSCLSRAQVQVQPHGKDIAEQDFEGQQEREEGEENDEEKAAHPLSSALLLDSRSTCWIWQLRGNVRKESCVKFPLFAYSSNTIKTSESGSHGNAMMSEGHQEGGLQPTAVQLSTHELNTVEINEIW